MYYGGGTWTMDHGPSASAVGIGTFTFIVNRPSLESLGSWFMLVEAFSRRYLTTHRVLT